jgi:hypothetical protein
MIGCLVRGTFFLEEPIFLLITQTKDGARICPLHPFEFIVLKLSRCHCACRNGRIKYAKYSYIVT